MSLVVNKFTPLSPLNLNCKKVLTMTPINQSTWRGGYKPGGTKLLTSNFDNSFPKLLVTLSSLPPPTTNAQAEPLSMG